MELSSGWLSRVVSSIPWEPDWSEELNKGQPDERAQACRPKTLDSATSVSIGGSGHIDDRGRNVLALGSLSSHITATLARYLSLSRSPRCDLSLLRCWQREQQRSPRRRHFQIDSGLFHVWSWYSQVTFSATLMSLWRITILHHW